METAGDKAIHLVAVLDLSPTLHSFPHQMEFAQLSWYCTNDVQMSIFSSVLFFHVGSICWGRSCGMIRSSRTAIYLKHSFSLICNITCNCQKQPDMLLSFAFVIGAMLEFTLLYASVLSKIKAVHQNMMSPQENIVQKLTKQIWKSNIKYRSEMTWGKK